MHASLRLLRLRRLRRLHRLLRRLSPGGVRRRRGLRVLTLMRALVRVPMVLVLVRVLVLVLALVCHLAVPPPRPPRYSRRLLRQVLCHGNTASSQNHICGMRPRLAANLNPLHSLVTASCTSRSTIRLRVGD